ncbi:MAG: tetratricopeptide repeat protein [Bacteroidota bacterium]
MLGNYSEEFPLLKKLLRTAAFRFVIIRYNHYSLVKQIEKDLASYYPNKTIAKLDAETTNFPTLLRTYLKLEGGMLWVENFGILLKEETNSLGEVTETMQKENDRRHAITSGLNLRRDKLAKKNNALLIFVAATPDDNYLRTMMEKMPDLWSFRSLFLNLEMEREKVTMPIVGQNTPKISIGEPTPSQWKKNEKEISRLLKSLATTTEADVSLKLSIYPSLTRLLVENGIYDQAIVYFQAWLSFTDEKQKEKILFDKGDALIKCGRISEALNCFEKALDLSKKYGNKNGEGLCLKKIGDIQIYSGALDIALISFEGYQAIFKDLLNSDSEKLSYKENLAISYSKLGYTQSSLGNLEKALSYFEEGITLFEELYLSYPQNVSYKNGLAIMYEKLGSTQSSLGNLEKALSYFKEDTKLTKELYSSYPQNVSYKNGLAISYSKLGSTQSSLGNLEKALSYFEKMTRLFEELYSSHPQNVSYKNGLAISYEKLGNTESLLGNLEKALDYFEKDKELTKELYLSYPQNVSYKNGLAISYSKLGDTQSLLGNLEKSLCYFEESNRLINELYSNYPQSVNFKNGLAYSYSNLGQFYRNQKKQPQKARSYFEKSYQMWKELTEQFPAYKEFQKNSKWSKEILENLP